MALAEIKPRGARWRQFVADVRNRETEFWRSPATLWDIIKFAVPLMIMVIGWGLTVEIRQARNEARFDATARAVTDAGQQQTKALEALQSSINKLTDASVEQAKQQAQTSALIEVIRGKR